MNIEDIKKKIELLGDLIRELKGQKDVKARIDVLANPENLDTMSVLTKAQTQLVATGNFLVTRPRWGRIFQGLADYAHSIEAPSISVNGRGREDAIRFMASINEAKLLNKLGINIKGEPKEK